MCADYFLREQAKSKTGTLRTSSFLCQIWHEDILTQFKEICKGTGKHLVRQILEDLDMKKLVRINAENVNSKFGYIVEEFGDAALIKVACDELNWLSESNCIILGSDLYEEI